MIDVKSLTKIVPPNQTILDNISFSIKKGELVILKGVSGSGKTTLLSILATLDKPTSGKVLINNQAVHKLPDLFLSQFRAQHIGFVAQHFNLIEHLSVWENLLIAKGAITNSIKNASSDITKALKQANILHKKDAIVKNLSGGEKQRTAIARALVNCANILLFDEPTAALDSKNSQIFLELLQTLHQMQKTIIVATHDPIFDTLKAKTFIMQDGKLYE